MGVEIVNIDLLVPPVMWETVVDAGATQLGNDDGEERRSKDMLIYGDGAKDSPPGKGKAKACAMWVDHSHLDWTWHAGMQARRELGIASSTHLPLQISSSSREIMIKQVL